MKKSKQQSVKPGSKEQTKVQKLASPKKPRGVTALSAGLKAAAMLLRDENPGLQKQLHKQKNGTGGLKLSKSNVDIPIDNLEPHPLHPKRSLDPVKYERRANSILLNGLDTPLLVTQRQDNPATYYILNGTRRWHAVRQLNWKKVRCTVTNILSDIQANALMLTIDGNRRSFDAVEKGCSFLRIRETLEISQEELANLLQIYPAEIIHCEIPKEALCQEVIDAHRRSSNQVRSYNYLLLLAKLRNYPEQQQLLYQKALEENWTIRQMRAAVKNIEPEEDREDINFTHCETDYFDIYIKAKLDHGIAPARVFECAYHIVDQICDWVGIPGEDVPKFYGRSRGIANERWRQERARIQAEVKANAYEEDPGEWGL